MPTAERYSLLAPRRSPLKRFIGFSVAAHVVVVGVGVLLAAIDRPPRVDLNQKPITASLVRLGKKRDEKLLPRKEELPPPPKEVKAPEPPSPEAPPPPPKTVAVPVPDLQPTPPQKSQPGEKTGEDRRKKLFSAFDKLAKKAPSDEEPEGAEDGDPMGDAARAEGERYFGMLKAQVQRFYTLSNTIPEDERERLGALVTIRIGRRGELLNVSLTKESDNEQYNSAVMAAVKRAAPFSPPPDHLREQLAASGVSFNFKASEL
ncbi:MAG: TonB C-terminal domain-containing protein [Myxococcaceae bacterium]|nr:TonB C-terminal domain-containing protein [Myxococcaceae bacterium]